MPVVHRFPHCQVRLYPRDHNPPHFHVLFNDGREAWIAIATLKVLRGQIPLRELAEVLAWAADHQTSLAEKFEELQR
jgi:hypothetical protein